ATGSTSATRKGLTVPFGHNIPRGLVRARKKEDVMSEMYQRLAHSSWDCKYHVVFVPKRRRKVLFGQARRKLGEVSHALARQKECQIIEGHLLSDHGHMCIAIPGKYPVPSVIGGFLRRNSSLGCRRYWGPFVPQLGGFRLEVLNLEFAVFKLVEGRSLVHVFHPAAHHAVVQAAQLGRHGFDGNRGTEPGSESTELRHEI